MVPAQKGRDNGRDVTNSPSNRPLVSSRAVTLPRGEQLVLLRRAWDHYVELRDGLPGVVQVTSEGLNDIASVIGIIVGDPSVRSSVFSDTPSRPKIFGFVEKPPELLMCRWDLEG
jgi:hypothetical protein